MEDYRRKAMLRIKSQYGWEGITDRYEELFASMLNGNDFKQRRYAARDISRRIGNQDEANEFGYPEIDDQNRGKAVPRIPA